MADLVAMAVAVSAGRRGRKLVREERRSAVVDGRCGGAACSCDLSFRIVGKKMINCKLISLWVLKLFDVSEHVIFDPMCVLYILTTD